MHHMLFEDILSIASVRNESKEQFTVTKVNLDHPVDLMKKSRGKSVLFDAGSVQLLMENALIYQGRCAVQKDEAELKEELREELKEELLEEIENADLLNLLVECRDNLTLYRDFSKLSPEYKKSLNIIKDVDKLSNLIQRIEAVTENLI